MRSSRPRRVAGAVVSVVLALAALVGLVALISSRDRSTFDAAQGPGRLLADGGDRHLGPAQRDPAYATDPPASGAHAVAAVRRDGVPLTDDQLLSALEQGDVVLVYREPAQAPTLRSLAQSVTGGPFDPAVAAAGQAVILDRRTSAPRGRVTALAWRRELVAASPTDARLRSFAQFWLGRGAPGTR